MRRPFQLVAEIQEKDSEIERLKEEISALNNQIVEMEFDKGDEIERLKKMYAEMFDFREELSIENMDLKALLTLAANALERVDKNWPNEWYGADATLIAELRKAAE